MYSVMPPSMSLWPLEGRGATHLTDSNLDPHPSTTAAAHTNSHSRRHAASSQAVNKPAAPLTPLQILLADEAILTTRKTNIRRFGATWLKPAGVAKTLQAMEDEEAEKVEQAETERRARVLAEETEAARLLAVREAARRQGGGGLDGVGDATEQSNEEGEGELAQGDRDLDEDIPEAEAAEWDEEGDDDPDDILDEDMINDGEENELDDEIDLDEDIPEAGSYQHTDTEIEDESSEVGFEDGTSEIMGGSSIMGSPGMAGGIGMRGRQR